MKKHNKRIVNNGNKIHIEIFYGLIAYMMHSENKNPIEYNKIGCETFYCI